MDKTVESYIRNKELEMTSKYENEKEKFLISQGLCEKIYMDIPEGMPVPEDVKWEYDSENDILKAYVYQALPVTDEEYKRLQELSKSPKKGLGKNAIGSGLRTFAWIMFIGGFILGAIMGATVPGLSSLINAYRDIPTFNFSLAMSYWGVSAVCGTLFLVFSEIINLLEDIKRK